MAIVLNDVETEEIDRYGNTKYFLNNMLGMEQDGSIVRAWGTQRDITDQKLAAEAVARQRRAPAPHYRRHSGRALGDRPEGEPGVVE